LIRCDLSRHQEDHDQYRHSIAELLNQVISARKRDFGVGVRGAMPGEAVCVRGAMPDVDPFVYNNFVSSLSSLKYRMYTKSIFQSGVWIE